MIEHTEKELDSTGRVSSILMTDMLNPLISDGIQNSEDSFYDNLLEAESYRETISNVSGKNDRALRSIESAVPVDSLKLVRDRLVRDHGNDVARAFFNREVRERIEKQIRYYLQEDNLVEHDQIPEMAKEYTEEIVGLGPIDDLMHDDSINEIMVNGPNEIIVDKGMGGGQVKLDISFDDEAHVLNIARKMLNLADASVNEANPICDARLPDTRINVVIPPVARTGTTITIRKFPPLNMTQEAMIENGLYTEEMADQSKVLVEGGANIFVVGATGSGKTTTMKQFAGHIPDSERTITMEDTAELRLKELYPDKHFVSLECRFTGQDDTNVDLGKLLKSSLRMYPSRVIVGETRSKEALDMIEIFNTGHDGGMSSLHSNSCEDSITRVIQMVLRNGLPLSPQVIGEMVTKAIDVVFFQEKMVDGTRRLTEVVEVLGYVDNKPIVNQLYRYEVRNIEQQPNGKIKIVGEHIKGEYPYFSETLVRKLMTKGVSMNRIAPWIAPKGDH